MLSIVAYEVIMYDLPVYGYVSDRVMCISLILRLFPNIFWGILYKRHRANDKSWGNEDKKKSLGNMT